jgi:hypothetical protein
VKSGLSTSFFSLCFLRFFPFSWMAFSAFLKNAPWPRPLVLTCFLYVDHISLFISAVLCTNTGKKELVCTAPCSKFTFG